MNPVPEKQINIELGENEAEGIYSNLVLITHSPAEFVIDFTRVLPGKPKAKVYSRIIMAPQHAKSLSLALQDNIDKYEKQFGEIKIQGMDSKSRNFGFQETNPT
ncbi:MAG: DUF3467 domain-containing protein [Calditrichaceae bacterium]|nr:DUF3467 domain-containing protein [Calditrichaceae bacterium]MBN2708242.1 DUF3467 domain-containing protein [Calditrichaceae bacterium]RQV92264.1 MAG: DUF3467 domain-containing protein [Calditrichota bacterium]